MAAKTWLWFLIVFSMLCAPLYAQDIAFTSPAGGEAWFLNSTHDLVWGFSGVAGGNVRLILLQNGQAAGVIAENVPLVSGRYVWRAGAVLNGTVQSGVGYALRMQNMQGVTLADSRGTFSLFQTTPQASGSVQVWQPQVTGQTPGLQQAPAGQTPAGLGQAQPGVQSSQTGSAGGGSSSAGEQMHTNKPLLPPDFELLEIIQRFEYLSTFRYPFPANRCELVVRNNGGDFYGTLQVDLTYDEGDIDHIWRIYDLPAVDIKAGQTRHLIVEPIPQIQSSWACRPTLIFLLNPLRRVEESNTANNHKMARFCTDPGMRHTAQHSWHPLAIEIIQGGTTHRMTVGQQAALKTGPATLRFTLENCSCHCETYRLRISGDPLRSNIEQTVTMPKPGQQTFTLQMDLANTSGQYKPFYILYTDDISNPNPFWISTAISFRLKVNN